MSEDDSHFSIRTLRQRIEQGFNQPTEELGRWMAFLRFQWELWKFCAKRLHQNNIMALSAALSFRTIFALIPVLVLAFLVLRSVGVVEDGKAAMRNFLDQTGFTLIVATEEPDDPTTQEFSSEAIEAAQEDEVSSRTVNVADEIEKLVSRVETKLTFERIGPIGALLLIWTALTLFTTLEASLNRVFNATKSRSIIRRIVLFWSVLTLGPILVMVTLYLSRVAIETCSDLPFLGSVAVVIGWVSPVIMGMLVVAGAYKLIPNTHVRSSSALGGALVSVPLWLLARWAFAVYVRELVLKGNLYGVLGLLPLFLLWLNVSWSIFLFGAELAHTATNLKQMRREELAEHMILGPSDWLAVMLAIARPYVRGQGPPTFSQVVEVSKLPGEAVQRVLESVSAAGLVFSSGEDRNRKIVLSKPPELIRLDHLLDLADPNTLQVGARGTRQANASKTSEPTEGSGIERLTATPTGNGVDGISQAVRSVHEKLRTAFSDQTLANLLDKPNEQ